MRPELKPRWDDARGERPEAHADEGEVLIS